MPTQPLYAESMVAARGDDLLRWWTNMMTHNIDGNVDSPTGWFCAGLIDHTDIATYVSEFGDPWISEHRNFTPGYYLVQINNDGLVFGHFYGDVPKPLYPGRTNRPRRRMLADFNRLTRLYFEWCGPDIGDWEWTDSTTAEANAYLTETHGDA